MNPDRVALSKPEERIATWCDCGKPVVGFAGVIRCECGRLWSVSRMLVGDVGGVQAERHALLTSPVDTA